MATRITSVGNLQTSSPILCTTSMANLQISSPILCTTKSVQTMRSLTWEFNSHFHHSPVLHHPLTSNTWIGTRVGCSTTLPSLRRRYGK
uniref:Uncharacterized protein n=1 Tax=Arundo donax TaxID=35708 RepID=A0A0A9DKF1_ARUDO